MKPFFCRTGSKRPLINVIKKYIPDHTLYVEPFVGGGAVLFGLDDDEIAKKKVINDLDDYLIKGFRLLKNASETGYNIPQTLQGQQILVNRKARNKNEELLQHLYTSCNTFGSTGKGKLYKNIDGENKLKNIPFYKDRLKNTTILSQDYKNVIKKYDGANTFFFIDPPYEKSGGIYEKSDMDFEELSRLLKNIKGYFMLTINDSKNIRNLFNAFNIKGISVRGGSSNQDFKGLATGTRKELIITNYKF